MSTSLPPREDVMSSGPTVAAGGGVVVVGSINADLVVTLERPPTPGETVMGRAMTVLPGGKGANQAVAAALLGADVEMIGAVGSDPYADLALSALTEAGVDLSAVHEVEGATGVAVVTVSDDGENTIVVLPGANAFMTPELVDSSASAIGGAALVLVQGELPAEATEAAVRAASGRVIVNLAPVIDIDATVLLRADPLVVNEHEGLLVLERFVGTDANQRDHTGVVEALVALGFASVVMTLGGEGALMSEGGGVHSVSAPRVDVVDTTGAGDAFVGALATQLGRGRTLAEAVGFAVRVGAYAVGRAGAQPSYPGLEDDLPALPARSADDAPDSSSPPGR